MQDRNKKTDTEGKIKRKEGGKEKEGSKNEKKKNLKDTL
jgi:hypothetical protein